MTPRTSPERLGYLDWLRGAAVLIMIESHVFQSMTRLDLHGSAGYALSQFIGGMAAPLFLFMAGVTLAFRMDRRERAGLRLWQRAADVLRRAGYIFGIAMLFRLQLWVFQWSLAAWRNMFRVDILNCMALAMAVAAAIALLPRAKWFSASLLLAAMIAGMAPLVAALDWSAVPWALRNYFVPAPNCFPFFPCAAYVPFGMAAGFVLRSVSAHTIQSVMRWCALIGFGLIFAGRYFSSLPYSIYAHSDFWRTSPELVTIRTGVILVGFAVAYLAMKLKVAGSGVIRQLGTTSLLVYWVHVELVYGNWLAFWKKQLTPAQAGLLAIVVAVLMYGLSLAKTNWTARKQPLSDLLIAPNGLEVRSTR